MKNIQPMALGICVIPFMIFPAVFSHYWITLVFTLLINVSLTGGINLLWGFGGYLNLGYMAFFGLGGYGVAILILNGFPFLISLLVGLILFLPVAGLLALPLFRLQGFYFSVASLGILILLEELAGKLVFLSGGLEGLSLPLSDHNLECYWLSLALAGLSLGANGIVNNKRLGFRLKMLQEDERTAESIGIPVFSAKVQAYVLGAAIAFLAGGIYIRQSGYIGPASAFGLSVAMPVVVMALIGGGKHWWGPLLGAVLITGLQELLWTALDRWVLSGYGIVIILLGLFRVGFGHGGMGRLTGEKT